MQQYGDSPDLQDQVEQFFFDEYDPVGVSIEEAYENTLSYFGTDVRDILNEFLEGEGIYDFWNH